MHFHFIFFVVVSICFDFDVTIRSHVCSLFCFLLSIIFAMRSKFHRLGAITECSHAKSFMDAFFTALDYSNSNAINTKITYFFMERKIDSINRLNVVFFPLCRSFFFQFFFSVHPIANAVTGNCIMKSFKLVSHLFHFFHTFFSVRHFHFQLNK